MPSMPHRRTYNFDLSLYAFRCGFKLMLAMFMFFTGRDLNKDPRSMMTYCVYLVRVLPGYRLKLVLSIWTVCLYCTCSAACAYVCPYKSLLYVWVRLSLRGRLYTIIKSFPSCWTELSIPSAWAVDREFVNIYLGPNWVPISTHWGQI